MTLLYPLLSPDAMAAIHCPLKGLVSTAKSVLTLTSARHASTGDRTTTMPSSASMTRDSQPSM